MVPTTSSVVIVKTSPTARSCGPSANFPRRIFGPCRSARIATERPVAAAAARTPSKFARWSSWEPWLKFSRATSIPASTSDRNPSVPATAGPRVQTIFALRMTRAYCSRGAGPCPGARRAPSNSRLGAGPTPARRVGRGGPQPGRHAEPVNTQEPQHQKDFEHEIDELVEGGHRARVRRLPAPARGPPRGRAGALADSWPTCTRPTRASSGSTPPSTTSSSASTGTAWTPRARPATPCARHRGRRGPGPVRARRRRHGAQRQRRLELRPGRGRDLVGPHGAGPRGREEGRHPVGGAPPRGCGPLRRSAGPRPPGSATAARCRP